MPSPAPPLPDRLKADLAALGSRIRQHRKALGVSAVATAEAAGISRVTLHRVERGEPSVAMGAYLGAIAALGLRLTLVDTRVRQREESQPLPPTVQLDDYPELRRLAWQLRGATELTPEEALDLYERNWRHVDQRAMTERERVLVRTLVSRLGGGRMLV